MTKFNKWQMKDLEYWGKRMTSYKKAIGKSYLLKLSLNRYAVIAWGGAPKTYLIKIERSLNEAVRIMLFQGKIESAQPLFQYLNILLLRYQSSYSIQSSWKSWFFVNMNMNMNNIYSFIRFKYLIYETLKVCNINCSKSYVGRGLKRLYLIQVKTTK